MEVASVRRKWGSRQRLRRKESLASQCGSCLGRPRRKGAELGSSERLTCVRAHSNDASVSHRALHTKRQVHCEERGTSKHAHTEQTNASEYTRELEPRSIQCVRIGDWEELMFHGEASHPPTHSTTRGPTLSLRTQERRDRTQQLARFAAPRFRRDTRNDTTDGFHDR